MSRQSLIEYFRKNDKWQKFSVTNSYGYYSGHYYYNDNYNYDYYGNIVGAENKEIQSASATEVIQIDKAQRNIFHYLFSNSAYLNSSNRHALLSLNFPKNISTYSNTFDNTDAFFKYLQQQQPTVQISTIAEVGKHRLAAISKSLIDKLSLEQKFAVLSTRDGQGNTPLHYATENCSYVDYFIDLVQAIGQLDAKQQQSILTTKNTQGQNILHRLGSRGFGSHAQSQGQWNNSALKHGLSAVDNDGFTPLHLALLGQLAQPSENRINFTQAGLACLLEQKGLAAQKGERKHESKQNVTDDDLAAKPLTIDDNNRGGYTLTSLACRAGATAIVSQLPAHYVQATAGSTSKAAGMNAFHYAARRGDTQLMIELIKKYPTDYDLTSLLMKKDSQGRTVLHHAGKHGNQTLLSVLLPRLSGQSWSELGSLQESLFVTAKNSGQGGVLNFGDAFNKRFSFYQVYDYLVKREKWWTRSDDYQQRLNDFKQILLHLNQGGSPTEIKGTTFYKKTHFCGLWAGSENYQNHKTQLMNSLKELAEETSSAEGQVNQCFQLTQEFIGFLNKQKDCPVAKDLLDALKPQNTKQAIDSCTPEGGEPSEANTAIAVLVPGYEPPPAFNPALT